MWKPISHKQWCYHHVQHYTKKRRKYWKRKLAGEIKTALKPETQDFAEAWRLARQGSANKMGPKRRTHLSPRVMDPAPSEWATAMAASGPEGDVLLWLSNT